MTLEALVENEVKQMKVEKVIVTSDYHIPYMDNQAYDVMKQFAKDYKPNHFVINGDLLDFYSLSRFEKNPDRKSTVKEDIELTRTILTDLRKTLGKKTNMYFLEGNHENRLQRFLWNNPELADLDELRIDYLLQLDKNKIKYTPVDGDYWTHDTGHLKLGDVIIMHGDNRLNGASTSKYSGYSVKNTIMGATQMNTIIGHIHRLNHFYHTTPYDTFQGLECGMLAKHTGTANWQQGFVTFELQYDKNNNAKAYNFATHFIKDGELKTDNKIYKSNMLRT